MSPGPTPREASTRHRCPKCGGQVWQVHRRRLDRWLSSWVRVHRYRCGDARCRWEGNFRSRSHGRHEAKTPAWVWVLVVLLAIVVTMVLVAVAGKGGGGGPSPTSRNYSTVVE